MMSLLFLVLTLIVTADATNKGFKTIDLLERYRKDVDGLPMVDELNTLEDLREFVRQDYHETEFGGGVVGLFRSTVSDVDDIVKHATSHAKSKSSSAAVATFLATAMHLQEHGFRFGLGTSEELLDRFNVQDAAVLVFKQPGYCSKEEECQMQYQKQEFILEELTSFIVAEAFPLVSRLTQDNEGQYLLQKRPVFLTLADTNNKHEVSNGLVKLLRGIAKRNPEGLFAVASKYEASMALGHFRTEHFGFSDEDVLEDDFVGFVCLNPRQGTTYRLAVETMNATSIESFLAHVLRNVSFPGVVSGIETGMQYKHEEL